MILSVHHYCIGEFKTHGDANVDADHCGAESILEPLRVSPHSGVDASRVSEGVGVLNRNRLLPGRHLRVTHVNTQRLRQTLEWRGGQVDRPALDRCCT